MQLLVYIVSTPIGNLNDISNRAIETLQFVDYTLCEDTRVSIKLFQSLGIKSNLMVYNDHNALTIIPKVIDLAKSGKTFALISDAGTPLVSDPGFKLINACIENNIPYTVIPGASAVISALVLSGLPSDRFMFVGFADPAKFQEVSKINSTLIFFESPNRIVKTLHIMKDSFKNRTVAVVREITKIHEETIRGNFDFVIRHFETNEPRGEFVILLSPPETSDSEKITKLYPLIEELHDKIPTKELSRVLSKYSGVSKNVLYDTILNYLKGKNND